MHALIVKFSRTSALTDVGELVADQPAELADVDGLVSATWIADGDIAGAFFLFDDASSADEYLHSDAFASVLLDAAFEHFKIQHFDVVEHVSLGVPASRAP